MLRSYFDRNDILRKVEIARSNINWERILSIELPRRHLLLAGGAFAGITFTSRRVVAYPKFANYPFTLGVASGDPMPESVVLWTRLAPNPLEPTSMPQVNVPVQWQVASDENMSRVVAKRVAIATPQLGHSVHAVAEGLEPNRWYWYRFKAGNEVSPIGRTRTAPALDSTLQQLAFAFVSCQNYEHGYFSAYRHLAEAGMGYWSDGWDGYPIARQRILESIEQQQTPNPIFRGGDIHSFWVSDLKLDFENPASKTVASEFVGTSIGSNGVPDDRFAAYLPDNPHIKFFESRLRGYVRCLVNQQQWVSDLRKVDRVDRPDAKISTLVSYLVEKGRVGAEKV